MKKITAKTKFIRVIIALIMFYVVYVLIQQQSTLNYYKERQDYYIGQIEAQEKELETLEKNKLMYDSDMFIEKMAREKLGYVKPGERVFLDSSDK